MKFSCQRPLASRRATEYNRTRFAALFRSEVMARIAAFASWLMVVVTGGFGAEPFPAPVPRDIKVAHRVCETVVVGPGEGRQRSLICELAGRPAALVYARDIDRAVTKLLSKLDAIAAQGQPQKMTSSCVLLSAKEDDKES